MSITSSKLATNQTIFISVMIFFKYLEFRCRICMSSKLLIAGNISMIACEEGRVKKYFLQKKKKNKFSLCT